MLCLYIDNFQGGVAHPFCTQNVHALRLAEFEVTTALFCTLQMQIITVDKVCVTYLRAVSPSNVAARFINIRKRQDSISLCSSKMR